MNNLQKTYIFVASLLICVKTTAISLPFASTIKTIYRFIDNQTIDENGNYLNVTITMEFRQEKGPARNHIIKRKLRANDKVDTLIATIAQQLNKLTLHELTCFIDIKLFANIKPNVYIDQELALPCVIKGGIILQTRKPVLDEIANLVKQALEALSSTSSKK